MQEPKDLSEVDDNKFYISVKWAGLPHKNDFTWQDLQKIYHDVPDMVQQYLSSKRKTNADNKAKKLLKLRMKNLVNLSLCNVDPH